MDLQKSFLENIDKNGLLPNSDKGKGGSVSDGNGIFDKNTNFFSKAATTPFGNLTTSNTKEFPTEVLELPKGETFDGFDTDILTNSKFKKIDNKSTMLEVKIARLRAELEDHKKIVEASFLKSDKGHYQKLLEIQQKMEAEIQRLVAEYQNRQLKSIVFSPFVKLFNFIKSYVVLR